MPDKDNKIKRPRKIRCQWCKKYFTTDHPRNDLCPACRANPDDQGLELQEQARTLKQYTEHLDQKLGQRISEQRAEILEDRDLNINALLGETNGED